MSQFSGRVPTQREPASAVVINMVDSILINLPLFLVKNITKILQNDYKRNINREKG